MTYLKKTYCTVDPVDMLKIEIFFFDCDAEIENESKYCQKYNYNKKVIKNCMA